MYSIHNIALELKPGESLTLTRTLTGLLVVVSYSDPRTTPDEPTCSVDWYVANNELRENVGDIIVRRLEEMRGYL